LRVTVWQHSRELSLFKLVRHFQASAAARTLLGPWAIFRAKAA